MQETIGPKVASLRPDSDLSDREDLLWLVVLVGLCADTALTYYGLQAGMYELNPVIRASIGVLGVLAGILAVKAVAVLTGLCVRWRVSDRLGPIVPAVLSIPWLLGATVNAVGLFGL